jgi:virulence-associated protein VagC
MDTARLLRSGPSQALLRPKDDRFQGSEVAVKHVGNGVLLLPVTELGELGSNPPDPQGIAPGEHRDASALNEPATQHHLSGVEHRCLAGGDRKLLIGKHKPAAVRPAGRSI